MLLARLVDAADAIERASRPAAARGDRQRALAVEHARHVAAEQRRQRDDDRAKEDDLQPADDGHERMPLEPFGPQQRVGEIDRAVPRSRCAASE